MDKILTVQHKFWGSFTMRNFMCVCWVVSEMQHAERHHSPLCCHYVTIFYTNAERLIALFLMKRFNGRRNKSYKW